MKYLRAVGFFLGTLGIYLVTLASLVSVPHAVNIGCGLVGIFVHHRVILAEERFLLKEYGPAYDAHTNRIRRYIQSREGIEEGGGGGGRSDV